MSNPFPLVWDVLTFKSYRRRKNHERRRANYEFLKAEIAKRHYAGFNGLVVEDSKFDLIDMGSFRPPMYRVVKNQDFKFCIFWDPKKMTEEIGDGKPASVEPCNDAE